jgi:hypothetical protein
MIYDKESKMTFEEVVIECCQRRELIQQFDRLQGSNVSRILLPDTRPPIVRMIDEATGYDKHLDEQAHKDMQLFIAFIFEFIFLPVLFDLD